MLPSPHIQNRKTNHFYFYRHSDPNLSRPHRIGLLLTSNWAMQPRFAIYIPTPISLQLIVKIEKMKIFSNAPDKTTFQAKVQLQGYLCYSGGQDDLIQMYLNREVFYQQELQRIQHFCSQSQEKGQQKTENPQPQSEETIVSVKEVKRSKKSIFHNFQKHLISTIKKYITFNKNANSDKEECIAFELWQAFVKTNSYNKRLLHTIFGAETDNPKEDFLSKLAQDFSEFKKIYGKYGSEKVLAAQEIIRQRVVQQSIVISKSMIKSNSSILKFQEFFEYYIHFISEISSGPMPKRMRKQSKISVLKILKLNQ